MENARPLDALNQARGKRVLVQLKTGKQFVGKLVSFDIHINTVLDEAEEREGNDTTRSLGTIFIRGDTIIFISPQWKEHQVWDESPVRKQQLLAGDVDLSVTTWLRRYAVAVAMDEVQRCEAMHGRKSNFPLICFFNFIFVLYSNSAISF